jgi:hypothetical protein
MILTTVLAIFGIPISSFLLGLIFGSVHERVMPEHELADGTSSDEPSESYKDSWRLFAVLLIVVVGCSLQILENPVINPTWLQYVVLIAVPLVVGYATRRVVAHRMSTKHN